MCSRTLLQQSLPVLNCRCRLTQVDLCHGCRVFGYTVSCLQRLVSDMLVILCRVRRSALLTCSVWGSSREDSIVARHWLLGPVMDWLTPVLTIIYLSLCVWNWCSWCEKGLVAVYHHVYFNGRFPGEPWSASSPSALVLHLIWKRPFTSTWQML